MSASAHPLILPGGSAAVPSIEGFRPQAASSSTMPLFRKAIVEPPPGEVTDLLHLASAGDKEAQNRLFQLVYPKLQAIAARWMAWERKGHTLQPSALVSEGYLRIVKRLGIQWENRAHFYRTFAKTTRWVLVDHFRRKRPQREWEHIPIDSNFGLPPKRAEEIVAIHMCLERLEEAYARQAAVVELKFFGGLSIAEIAEHLNVSEATVEADWRFARAWLRLELESTAHGHPSRPAGAGPGAV